jgi:cellulose synthase/poly-beta-1,6-N-acetylglucosamine synthase-like glycosyltransferase
MLLNELTEYFFKFLYLYNVLVLVYFFSMNSCYIVINFFAFLDIKSYLKLIKTIDANDSFNSSFYYPISVIVPAYNESLNIIETVQSLFSLKYMEFEIIVVSDGSNDDTVEKLVKEFKLELTGKLLIGSIETEKINRIYNQKSSKKLTVVDKDNGGKADAINVGINAARYPIVCVIDADSVLEQDSLLKASTSFMMDSRVVAVGGIIRLANGCEIVRGNLRKIDLPKNFLAKIQVIEYLRAFLFGRSGWNYFNSMFIISGAFGLFKRDVLIELGGYKKDCIGEDMEIIMRIHDHMIKNDRDYLIKFIPDPVCWTEAPEDYKTLAKQRNRWQRGLLTCMFTYRHMCLNPKYKAIGWFVYPFTLFFEAFNPLFEFVGYVLFALSILIGAVDYEFIILFLSFSILFGCILSLFTLILEELSFRRYPRVSHIIQLFFYSIFENLGYRQIHSYWRFRGFVDFFRGKSEWGKMTRKGISTKQESAVINN